MFQHSFISYLKIILVLLNLVTWTAVWQQQQQQQPQPQPQYDPSIITEVNFLKVDDQNDKFMSSTATRISSISSHSDPLEQNHRSLLQPVPSPQDDLYNSLQNTRILVAIAAFDLTQLPHLEEVLDSYHDVCVAGATVHVVIHTTVVWPVPLLDLLQSRFSCNNINTNAFQLEIIVKKPSVRLHLVDCHRQLFYDRIDEYDLFIYTEDDIRVTARTIATYLQETKRIERIVLLQQPSNEQSTYHYYEPSDFNIGIVRYEYNFPSNLVIDDSTRHATENVTRVYWEHSSFSPPIVPNAVDRVPQEPLANSQERTYVHMKNHHQGMFLATRSLLKAWKDRPNCHFDVASNRPGHPKYPSQPLFGTQRVWMSSLHLYGKKHGCNVQQVLPLEDFGALTVHHIPNKNYRRVGNYRTRDVVKDDDVQVVQENLLSALQLHLVLVQTFRPVPHHKQQQQQQQQQSPLCITMKVSPEIKQWDPTWRKHMDAYEAWVERGGILDALSGTLAKL